MSNLTLLLLVAGIVLLGANSILMSLMQLVFALTRNLLMLVVIILFVLFFLSNHLVYVP